MPNLDNHPRAFLSVDAAPSLLRMEKAHGAPFHGSSFGRTVAEQQSLIDDWNLPAAGWNRPPNLYKPYMPAKDGPHVVRGGEAFDCIDAAERAWIDAHGREYGWYRNIPDGDPVHVIYVKALDQHINDVPATAGTITTSEGEEEMAVGALVNVHDDNVKGGGNPVKLWIEAGTPDRAVNDDTARQLAKLSRQDVDNLAPDHDFERSQWNDLAKARGQRTI